MSPEPVESFETPVALPPSAHTVGMWLFLAALFMLFASSLLAYGLIRTASQNRPMPGTIQLPAALWVSTALVIGVSVAIAWASSLLARGLYRAGRKTLIVCLAFAAAFVTVQTPAMISLLLSHRSAVQAGMPLYGLIFFLILLHALHVVGGIVPLVRLTLMPRTLEQLSRGVMHTGMYWHFLDLIWIAMFTTFIVLQ